MLSEVEYIISRYIRHIGVVVSAPFLHHNMTYTEVPETSADSVPHLRNNRCVPAERREERSDMSTFRRMLLCYDATHEGQCALREAGVLAQRMGAQVHVLSILNMQQWTQGADIMSGVPFEAVNDAARALLAEGVRRLTESGIRAIGHFTTGDPLVQIPRFVTEFDIDLIVVGHRRSSRIARWWSGATDRLLLDRVACSVLVATGSKDESDESDDTGSRFAPPEST
jgi:nucleotide-binding universal stress UspA family protein